jgi:hypothetical protein
VFHMDVAYDAIVSKACCKRLFKVFRLFQMCVVSFFIWMLHMFHTYVAKSIFQMFSAVSFLCYSKCFYIASVLSRCCICLTYMLQVYIPNVLSTLDLCCIQVVYVASVSCFKGIFRESWGTTRERGKGRGELRVGIWGARRAWGPADRVCLSPSGLLGPACVERERERRRSGERSARAQPGCV